MQALPNSEDEKDRSYGLTLAASLSLHGLLAFALLSVMPEIIPDADETEERRIEVEFIPFAQLSPSPPEPAPTAPNDGLAAVPPAHVPEESPTQQQSLQLPTDFRAPRPMVRASRLMSASLLSDPANAEGRKEFYGLTNEEQEDQLCDLEALEQIRAWNSSYVPERMVSYTFEEVRYEGNRIIADGAAFWSKENWHRLKYDCVLSDDRKNVVNFSFLVGVIVPKDQWEQYDLTEYK
ncbi:DUF930 domain-containing protein [uncultured Cohaesibacter sp.]|uniref:DUF930 domain-containing protein n=1 Tax=uncultured Cohaesibacter sp. TaxID=1002546 RepID=UPI0029C8A143|nr:DUF930 domain-containing protein [uncultured Cohaesibacter sp.]